ncbi:hypothetical protein VNO77_28013 [Canavalia gladiata]|uniref:Uncharacterized protein n=1 Tax=Canavalia gladiata TaxID=3824 RepID=A0AAN9QB12_CANGL
MCIGHACKGFEEKIFGVGFGRGAQEVPLEFLDKRGEAFQREGGASGSFLAFLSREQTLGLEGFFFWPHRSKRKGRDDLGMAHSNRVGEEVLEENPERTLTLGSGKTGKSARNGNPLVMLFNGFKLLGAGEESSNSYVAFDETYCILKIWPHSGLMTEEFIAWPACWLKPSLS